MQEQVYKLIQTTYQQTSLPPQFQQELDQTLKDLARDLGNLSGFVDRMAMGADRARDFEEERQRIQATAGMQAVEIERLRGQVESLRLRLSAAEKNNEEVQNTYQHVLLTMEDQNKRDQEKLKVRSLLPDNTRRRY